MNDAYGLIVVNMDLQNMNYYVPSTLHNQDHKDDILQSLPEYTVFYMLTRAEPDGFGDCFCPYEGGTLENLVMVAQSNPTLIDKDGKNLFHVDIINSIMSKSLNQPPYNLVFVDGCETAGTTNQPISHTLQNAFSINGSDRAFIGWHNEIYASSAENRQFKTDVFDNLAGGDTLGVAVEKAAINGDPSGEGTRGDPTTEEAVFPQILGDAAMKLHGVYSGLGSVWFKPQ